jgi:5-oxoprolinase (ATP-hydrolysing) subunit A
VRAIDGSTVRVEAASLCVHGDTPGAVTIARAIRAEFAAAGIDVAGFCPLGS